MNEKKQRVLLYSALPEKVQGGIATWTNTYLQECEEHNISCDLVNCVAEGARANNPEAKLSIKDEIKRTIRIFKDLRNATRAEYDIAHINTSCGPMGIIRDCMAVLYLRKKRIRKIVVHFHCDIPFWVKNKVSRLCLKSMCKNSDVLLVLCRNSKAYLERNYHVNSIIVPNFVSEENIISRREINNHCYTVIYVGGIQPEKGCYEIFSAAKKLTNKKFIMVGQLDETVDISDISDNVYLVGSKTHHEVLELLDDADVFLFPSHSEGFSLSLAEAMSRGLPVITTDVGANVDMHENIGGRTVSIGNASEIEDAIEQIEEKKIRSKMSEWNIAKVKNNYTTSKVLELFYSIYK